MLPNKILIYPSAIATFYVPSDLSGISGMCSERIHAVDTWHQGVGRYDCMFINTDTLQPDMCGLDVAHARLFFSFTFEQVSNSCTFKHTNNNLISLLKPLLVHISALLHTNHIPQKAFSQYQSPKTSPPQLYQHL